jgi:SAM-dependent methyltransferase
MQTPASESTPQFASRRERWIEGRSPRAIAFRWLMGPQGHLLSNGPLYRLPENLKLTPQTRLLDVGCGRGTLMRMLDEQVAFEQPPVGLDLSPKMLSMAKRDQRRDDAPRGLAQGSATELPFADNSFTLVTAGYVVKHLNTPDFDAFLREVYRVLAPGGLALIWEFGPTGDQRLDAWNAKVIGPAGEHVRLRSTRTLREHADAAGFGFTRDADLRPFFVPPIPRASILIGIPPDEPPAQL